MTSAPPGMSRVTIVTNGNFFSRVALDRLFRETVGQVAFQVIVTTGMRRQRGNRALEGLRLARRWGSRYALYKATSYGLPALFGAAAHQPAFVIGLCRKYSLSSLRVRNVNEAGCIANIREFGPDLLISYSCPYRIMPSVLSLPRLGCLNAHSSLLPAYAGVCTYIHVLARGEQETGMTIHEMVDAFDAGRIVEQERLPIGPNTSVFALFAQQCDLGGTLLAQAMRRCLEADAIIGEEQDSTNRSYFGEPKHSDIAALYERGHRLLHTSDMSLLWNLLKR